VRRPEIEPALVETEIVTRRLRDYEREGLVRSVQSVTTILPRNGSSGRARALQRLPRAAAIDFLREALQRHDFVTRQLKPFSLVSGLRGARSST